MKRYLLCVCLVLFPMTACSDSSDPSTAQEIEYQRQVKIYDEQSKIAAEQQAETERQLKESASLQEATAKQLQRAEIQYERNERLLDRWEKQADRYDALLDRWEKQDRNNM